MPKNIALFCDGTSNQFAGNQTNVIHLYRCASRVPGTQLTFYDPGVGTMPVSGLFTKIGKRLSVLMGLAIGLGFTDNLRDAYCFLMENYEPGDKVFLFGFSRGAYTARALAGMLHAVGLLNPGTDNLIPYAMRYWRKCYTKDGAQVAADFKRTMARECKVHFIGVWDTVGSVGWFNSFQTFPYTRHNPDVDVVRHAVSIDERRCCFRHNLMVPDPSQDFRNVWFAGVHSDVGGGYPEMESGLSKIALEWVAIESQQAGLILDKDMVNIQLGYKLNPNRPRHTQPDAGAKLHKSLHGGWWLVELLPRRQWHPADGKMHWGWGPARPRSMPSGATGDSTRRSLVHESVVTRMKQMTSYKPVNLPASYDVVKWNRPPT